MDYNKFLETIAQIESSGGKNLKHPTIKKGLQTGQTAVGKYGLLPNTIEEMVKRAELEGTALPEMEELASLDQAEISNRVKKDPELEDEIAFRMYDHINKKGGRPEEMAYMWNSGHNRSPASIDDVKVNEDPYVKKFNKAILSNPVNDPMVMQEMRNAVEKDISGKGNDSKLAALERLSRGY